MLPFTKKSCAAAEMSDRRLYLTCRLTTGRGLNVRVTSLHRNEHVSNSFSLFLFPFFLENFSAFESYRNLDSFLVTRSFHDLLKGEKLYNEKLKSEKLINEKFVVVEREYRGLEIESEERACIYIYVYIICLLDVRFIRDSRYRMEKSEEYGRENGPDRKEMNCQHCLLI